MSWGQSNGCSWLRSSCMLIHVCSDFDPFKPFRRVPDFAIFSIFFIFMIFGSFGPKKGPKGAREGFQRVRGKITLHLDQVSAQMEPSWAQSGPFLFFNFLKTHLGPKWLQVQSGSSSHKGPRAPGGRRPTFRRPKADILEGCGEAEPPHKR